MSLQHEPLLGAPTNLSAVVVAPEGGSNAVAALSPSPAPHVDVSGPSHEFVFPDSGGMALSSAPSGQSTNVMGPASELLLVTPQMLVEFFKPLPGASNPGPVRVVVPVDVGFRPPLASPGPSSQAIYRAQ